MKKIKINKCKLRCFLTFDGDGRVAKRLNRHRIRVNGGGSWIEEPEYTIFSSVTGKQITTLTQTGGRYKAFVYAGSSIIAEQTLSGTTNSYIAFKQSDPVTGSEIQTKADGELSPNGGGRSDIGDTTNIKRSATEYYLQTGTNISTFGLVKEAKVYGADETTVEKKSAIEYNLDAAYISKRIIGLPAKTEAFGLNQSSNSLEYVSKVTYNYDEGEMNNPALAQDISPVQHDDSNFSASVQVGRGNLTSVTRHDVMGQTASVTTSVKYNTAGAPVEQTDVGNRKVEISYADAFNDNQNSRNTFAYPTKLTEVANTDTTNNYSSVKYRFDTGANVWAKSPKPENNSSGKETTRLYDAIGRLQKEILVNTGAYTRYEYPANNIQSKVFATVIDTNNNGADSADEVYAESWTDGAGRVLRAKTEHPTSAGNNWAGTLTEYDILGRVTRSTIPTEINSNYEPAGDDATRGFLWKHQKYDWKSRVVRIINTDGVDSPTLNDSDQLFSYEGCGCAGGQITTVQGELVPRNDQPNVNARRTQKIYADILGRTKKTEIMNWDNSVYTTTTQIFNGRDQVLQTTQYAGAESSSNTHQDVTMTYDGHGRMKTRHYPIEGTTENPNASTSWIYNNDDSIQQVIDPRNAITTFAYNSRGLMNQISYSVPSPNPSNITTTPNVSFTYDALANRTSMSDGTGTQVYNYDQLSRITSETKTFSTLAGNSFTIGYTYNLGGGLKSITDPFNATVNYTNDKTGRVTGVAGTPWAENPTGNYANNIEYRAFGQVKRMNYTMPNDNIQINLQYDNRLRVSHSDVTSETITGNYLMKADYSYFADSRVSAKDDLLDNKWDRTMKYDFAGRLTFNQFGLGLGSDGSQMKRVYQQTITYDAFSQMNQRDTLHWDNQASFTETYTNGRISNNPNIVYDAAGNLTDTTDSISPHDFQHTTFDASGRRTAFYGSSKGRWGSILNMVTQHKSGYDFDGDGRPVVEREGYQSYHVNQPPPAPWQPEVRSYQVWSSVLGSSLTTINTNGTKSSTKVFAGNAVIGGEGTNFGWRTADPVTGTVGSFSYTAEYGTHFYKEETEPLGQTLHPSDPADIPEPPANDSGINRADDPHWQCTAGAQFYGGFTGMPFHCQLKALLNAGDKLPWEEASPNHQPSDIVDSPMPAIDEFYSESDEILTYAQKSTVKPQDDDKKKKKKRKERVKPTLKHPDKNQPRPVVNEDEIEKPILPANLQPIDWDNTNFSSAEFADHLNGIVNFVYDRTQFINTNQGFPVENNDIQFRIRGQIIWMIGSLDCVNAFKAAGLPTPAEILRDRGMTIASGEILRRPSSISALGNGFNENYRMTGMVSVFRSGVAAFTMFRKEYNEYPTARIFTFYKENGVGSDLEENIIHEMIHAAGVGEVPGTGLLDSIFGNDLSGYEHYAAILKACASPR